jgi:hypothetical protein
MHHIFCYPKEMAMGIVKKFIEFVEFLGFYNPRNHVNTRNCVNFNMKGGEKMRKILICFIAMASLILFGYGSSYAVNGPCVACHTMHNSQNNSAMNFNGSTTPNPILLRGTCLGCHAQNKATKIFEGYVPQVRNTSGDLAGGNFRYLFGDRDVGDTNADTSSVAHNVWDFGILENVLSVPPGDENATGITAGGTGGSNLTCAGQWGCHGDRTVSGSLEGIKGSHHSNRAGSITVASADSPGHSYRFLNGVAGFEDSAWEDTTDDTHHNVYYGVTSGVEGTAIAPGSGTISGLCAECHGNFHGPKSAGDIYDGTYWIRHPTDAILPNTGEYASYWGANGAVTYDTRAPIGKTATTPQGPTGTVVPGTDVVICLSCHKAHASANADILRWNYTTIQTGTGAAEYARCFICHTEKDDNANPY